MTRRAPATPPAAQPKTPVLIPELIFYAVILILPFEQMTTFAGFAITKWVGGCFFILALAFPKLFFGVFPKSFIFFFLYISIGMLIDIVSFPLTFQSINEFVRPALMGVLMLATYNLAINKRFGRIIFVIYLSSLIYVIFQVFELGGAYTRVDAEVVGKETFERIAVLSTDENFAACYFAISVLVGLIHGLNLVPTKLKYRVLALLGSAIGFYAILKTASRGGFIAITGAVMCIVFTAKILTVKVKYAFYVCFLLAAIIGTTMSTPLLRARMTAFFEKGETSGRTAIWEQTWQLAKESPIYGYGYRMHQFSLGARTGKVQRGTHNLFLSVLLGSGFLGLSLFLCFYYQTFQAAWRARTEGLGKVVFLWFMLCFLASMSLNSEIAKWFWIILALSLAAGKVYGKKPITTFQPT